MSKFKPQLLYRFNPPLDQLPYPVLMSPKVDGIRVALPDGTPKSRTLKKPPNPYIERSITHALLSGFDAEITVGAPNEPGVFQKASTFWKRHNLEQHFNLWVFDDFTHPNEPFWDRYRRARARIHTLEQKKVRVTVNLLEHFWVNSPEELLAEEQRILGNGFEGAIIRCPNGKYKYGRTTLPEMNAFKLKRFIDSTAIILDIEEGFTNTNEAYIAESGYQKRSTHQEGLVPNGRAGHILVRDTMPNNEDHQFFGVEFYIGSGWDHEFGAELLRNKAKYIGKEIEYKYFAYEAKDAPRHGIFNGIRHATDKLAHDT